MGSLLIPCVDLPTPHSPPSLLVDIPTPPPTPPSLLRQLACCCFIWPAPASARSLAWTWLQVGVWVGGGDWASWHPCCRAGPLCMCVGIMVPLLPGRAPVYVYVCVCVRVCVCVHTYVCSPLKLLL